MKKHLFTMMLLAAALLLPKAAVADELTVCDGSATNSYLPVWGLWLDNNTHTQSIYSESLLSDMAGGTISQMTWYVTSAPTSAWISTFTVRLMETTETTMPTSGHLDVSTASVVYTGTLTVASGLMVIELDDPFPYTGGNLLVDFQSVAGNWSSVTYAGENASGNVSTYSRTSYSPTTSQFLPKVTFEYSVGSGSLCRKPINLTASDVTTDGATFTWNTRNGESAWNIYIDGEYVTMVYDSTYTANGLTASAQHTFGVSAVCDDAAESPMATLFFRTACDLATLPWSDGFEGYTSTFPDCWTRLQGYSTSSISYPTINNYNAHTGNYCLYFYNYSSTPNLVVTPMFSTPVNQLHVVFWARIPSGELQAGVMTDTTDTSTFIPILTIAGNSSTYIEYEFFTDTIGINDLGYVAFRHQDAAGYSTFLDDVFVEVASDCRRPVTASVAMPTYESAVVSWTDNGTATTAYTVRVSRTSNVNDTAAVDHIASSSPYTVTGLDANTTYYVWVSTLCGSDQTMWREAGSVTTQQDCYPLEDIAVGDIVNGQAVVSWQYNTTQGRTATGVDLMVVDHSTTPFDTTHVAATGTHHFLQDLQSGHTYTVEATTECGTFDASSAVTATIVLPACGRIEGSSYNTNNYLPFNCYYNYSYTQSVYPATLLQGLTEINGIQYNQYSTASSNPNRHLRVWMGNTTQNMLDTNNYIPVDSMTLVFDDTLVVATNNSGATGWKTINFSENFTWDGTSNIIVAVQNITGQWSNNVSWAAHQTTGYNGVYWYSDNDTIRPENPNALSPTRAKSVNVPDITFLGDCAMPSCLSPLAAISDATNNSVTLEWMAGNEDDSWTVEYRAYGDTAWSTFVASTTLTTATVTGLAANTVYEFRVGSLCSGSTLYGGILLGRTECGTITLPYSESFEGWNSNEFPACWFQMLTYNGYPSIATSAHSGANSMRISTSTTADGMFASPVVPAAANSIKVTFWASSSSATLTDGSFHAGIVTDPTDPTTFQECTLAATGLVSGSWHEFEFYTDDVTATGNVHIAFMKHQLNDAGAIYIDDVTIAVATNCRRPNTPSVSNVSYYSADLAWNDVNQGTVNYEVRYSTINDVNAAGYHTATTNDDNISLSGLSNNTVYYAWVRPQCSSDDADWLPFGSFHTLISCYPVSGVSLSGRTFTTVAVEWNYNYAQGMSPQGVVLNLMDLADSTMMVVDEYTEEDSYIFTGLTAGHQYKLWLATLCDPDTAAAVDFIFATVSPSCGEEVGATPDSVYYYPSYGYYNYSYSQSLYPSTLAASVDTINGISLRVARNTQTRTFDVYLANTDLSVLGTSSFVPASDLTLVASNHTFSGIPGWVDILFDTPFVNDGRNLVVAVVDKTGSYTSSYLYYGCHSTTGYHTVYSYTDSSPYTPANVTSFSNQVSKVADIRLLANCDLENLCTAPIVVLDSVSASSVSLQWATDNATTYTVQYRADGDTAWVEAVSDLTATAYTVSGLDASTLYSFRVGITCGEHTIWSAPLQTYTECTAMPVPQTFTFTSELTPCWTLTNNNVSRSVGSSALYWVSSPNNVGFAVVPELAAPINSLMAIIRARYAGGSTTDTTARMLVGVGNSQGGNVTWVDTVTLGASYADHYIYFNGYTGGENHIVISKVGGNYLYVERISVGIDNDCHPINFFYVSGTSSNTATFSYSHPSASSFELQYRVAGDATWQSQVVSGTTATITGLSATTNYEARIRAICSATDSSFWSASVSFTTDCGAISIPWSENFDAWTAINQCWERRNGAFEEGGTTGSGGWNPSSSYGTINISGKALTMNLWSTSKYWVVMPPVDMNVAGAILSFDLAAVPYNTSSTFFDSDDRFIVAVSTDGSSWTPIFQLGAADTANGQLTSLTANYTTFTVPFSGYLGQEVYIAFYAGSTASGGDTRLALDNISLVVDSTVVTPCDAPTNVAVNNVTTNTATISWTENNGATAWVLDINPDDPEEAQELNINANPYVLSGLTPGTTYSVRVRSACDALTSSEWSAAVTFTTDSTSGISIVDGMEVSLYPNPATSEVTLRSGDASRISIVDQSGRTVYHGTMAATMHRIDVSGFSKGAYYVRVVGSEGIAVRKLIIR